MSLSVDVCPLYPKEAVLLPFFATVYNSLYTYCMCEFVAQLCQAVCNPVDCSAPGSSVHGILQARILEWVAISFSRKVKVKVKSLSRF